jgi:chromosome segregation protein
MIESKMIETILSEDPSIRRSLFEEAAGVAKYRLQKRAAQRRMEATTEDLLRVQDIIDEVEKKVRSLKRQAGRARVHEKFNGELREVDLQVAALDRDRLQAEERTLAGTIGEAEQARGRLAESMDGQEREIRATREALEANESGIGQIQDQIIAIGDQIQQEENRLAVVKERRSGIEQAMQRREQDIVGLLAGIGRFEDEARRLQSALSGSSAGLLAGTERLRAKESELGRADAELTSAKLALAEARRELMDLLRQESQGKEQLAIMTSRHDALRRELERATAERTGLEAEAEQAARQLADLEGRTNAERTALSVLAEEKARLKAKGNEQQNQLFLADHQLSQASSDLYALRKERELLAGWIERGEGYGSGAQFLLAQRSDLPGRLWPLAELIDVAADRRPAIESLLGAKLQWLVAENDAVLRRAVDLLRREKKGKATVVDLSAVAGAPPPAAADGATSAASAVRCDAAFRPLMQQLLGGCLVADSYEDLWRLRQAHPGALMACRGGEAVDPGGAVTAGQLPEGQLGLLERRGRLEELADLIRQGEQTQAAARQQMEQLKTGLAQTQQRLEEADREHEKYQRSLVESEKEQARLRASLDRQQQRLGQIEGALADLNNRADQLAAELAPAQESFREISENNREEHESLAAREREIATAEQQRRALAEEAAALRLSLSALGAEADRCRQEIAGMESRRNESMERIQSLRSEDESGLAAIAALQQEAESSSLGLSERTTQRAGLMARREGLQKVSQQSFVALRAAEEAQHAIRVEGEEWQRKLSEAQLALSTVRNDLANTAQRVRAEHDADLAALAAPSELDQEAARARIDDLRLRLKKLGPINFAAYEELATEEQRLTFMTGQRDDLVRAKQDLELSIKKIDETAKQLFLETLEGIQRGFVQIFQRLFIGGEADIRLIGSDDPLEAEIEIMATPLGKTMKSITLLSGGEKAMTAIALLFGIYLVKPAPFCVLDEVDAPLDDANVQRFCAMLRDFVGGTQFMVITHNKRTMEIADRLYGVTMEQPGVSRVVSVKFE